MKLLFRDVYRASEVSRWHIVNTSRQQTVAEHMWLVAMTYVEICKRMGFQVDPQTVLDLMEHDLPETRTGDIPTPAKRLIRSKGPALDELEAEFEPLNGGVFPEDHKLWLNAVDAKHRIMADLSDIFEAYVFITHHGIGPHAKDVADKIKKNMHEIVNKYPLFRGTINSMLSEIGMDIMKEPYGE
jgi:5'-deoxynucleotidase